jgi:hypothetical protein
LCCLVGYCGDPSTVAQPSRSGTSMGAAVQMSLPFEPEMDAKTPGGVFKITLEPHQRCLILR